jgi:AraC-like DNA-binding protein
MSGSEIVSLASASQIARESLLEGSSSAFASLATLSSLPTDEHGTYTHEALTNRLGTDLLQRAVGKLRSQVFYDWLKTPLDSQWAAVKHHLREICPALETEVRVALFADYAPESAASPERQLFEADLTIVLMLISSGQVETAGSKCPNIWRLAATLRTVKALIGNRKLTLGYVADILKVSKNYLGCIFRRHTGLTFHQYLSAARMVKTADLLRSSPLPLKEVALLLGYTNGANLCRDFLRAFREGPTSYRIKALLDSE